MPVNVAGGENFSISLSPFYFFSLVSLFLCCLGKMSGNHRKHRSEADRKTTSTGCVFFNDNKIKNVF